MNYPTLPFALVYYLAQVTPERAKLASGGRHVGIYVHKDRSVSAIRLEIMNDEQLPQIEAEVARMMSQNDYDTVALTFSTTDSEPSDIGVIIEKDKDPMIFNWQYSPQFGITLVDDKETADRIDTWSGVRLARDLVKKG
ncbi:hypothetical protein [uncultured Salinicola sp.]|uniref:hypothetical protein n=1 Tax=uncultured Salinicola sp. TaxID=1193542 RepID=UPI00262AE92F|nr:hypothetical protein [uncultured Salinicola sp.]|tara:strand:+ start:384 stop:800 length:417 start_codon:yes stop_codon:yes gene_type:complete